MRFPLLVLLIHGSFQSGTVRFSEVWWFLLGSGGVALMARAKEHSGEGIGTGL